MATKPAAEDKPLGSIIDAMEGIRAKRRALKEAFDAKDEPLKKEYDELEKIVIARFLKEESMGNRGKKASANLQRNMTFSVSDRAAVEAWAKKTGNLQIFTNHLSSKSIVEVLAMKKLKEIPGVKSFEKLSITLTSLGE